MRGAFLKSTDILNVVVPSLISVPSFVFKSAIPGARSEQLCARVDLGGKLGVRSVKGMLSHLLSFIPTCRICLMRYSAFFDAGLYVTYLFPHSSTGLLGWNEWQLKIEPLVHLYYRSTSIIPHILILWNHEGLDLFLKILNQWNFM